jgi:hypothetical protein
MNGCASFDDDITDDGALLRRKDAHIRDAARRRVQGDGGAAINATGGSRKHPFTPMPQGFLDPFQTVLAITLELLETAVFPFASHRRLQYL